MDLHHVMLDAIREEMEAEEQKATARARAHAERALAERARAFLAKLDPDSSEGMWFDALAESYDSRTEAAIVYLRDVKREGG